MVGLPKVTLSWVLLLLCALAFGGAAAATERAGATFVRPDTPVEAMYADQTDCEADARYSRVVTYANLSSGYQYNNSIASTLGLLVAGAIVSGRGARATPDDFVQRCMAWRGYNSVPLLSREATARRRARNPEARLAWVQTLHSSEGFAERAQQANSQSAADAPAALRSSWVFGEVIALQDAASHFELGPNDAEMITTSRLLPAVLVTLDEDVTSEARADLRLKQGEQLFQLSGQSNQTYCTLAPVAERNYLCLADLNNDVMADTLVLARSLTPSLPLLELDPTSAVALTSPTALRTIASEECICDLQIALIHWGRRSMGRRDAGFTISISRRDRPDEPAASPMFSLFFDDLPGSLDLLGVRFENISPEDRTLRFDLASGFERGAFYDPYYGGTYVEWGF